MNEGGFFFFCFSSMMITLVQRFVIHLPNSIRTTRTLLGIKTKEIFKDFLLTSNLFPVFRTCMKYASHGGMVVNCVTRSGEVNGKRVSEFFHI